MRTAFRIELIKVRRTLALLMLFVSPAMVALLQLMMTWRSGPEAIADRGWGLYWASGFAIWAYFMLPLYIALISALVNQVEHKNSGWRLLMTLPLKRWQVFIAKAVLIWGFTVVATTLLMAYQAASIILLGLIGFETVARFDYPAMTQIGKVAISCLPILMIQHTVAWRWSNIAVPLGLGIVGTMGIVQMASSEYWIWNPWTYPLTAGAASEASRQSQSLGLSAVVTVILLFLVLFLLSRDREIDQ